MKRMIFQLFWILLPFSYNYAGNVIVKSRLDSVCKDGFYKIQLLPEIISASKPDYEDIRIFDSKNREVPYILKEEQQAIGNISFKEYQVLENSYLPGLKSTKIVVVNKPREVLERFSLIVRNSEIEKEITLKGSDDKVNWYIIQKDYPVRSSDYDETSEIMELSFPKSNYQYFELSMNDKKNDPLRVIKVGCFSQEAAKGVYMEIPSAVITQKDSLGMRKSYITLKFNQIFEISRLTFTISGNDLYLRNCSLGKFVIHNKKTSWEDYGEFQLSSKTPLVWEFPKLRTDELIIVIENTDNQPLHIQSVKAYQLSKYLIARLKAGEYYEIQSGNEKLSSPEYDLKFFTDSIPNNLPILKAGMPSIQKVSETKKDVVIFTKSILWIIIGLVIALLAFLSIRMVNEMRKQDG